MAAGSGFRASAAKAAAFTPGDWALLAESLATLVLVSVGLRVLPFPRLATWATRRRPSPAPPSPAALVRVVRFGDIASRFTPFKCLTRSLALARALARRGAEAEVRIGVQTRDGLLTAHAWVEYQGRVLNDSAAHVAQYAPFDPSRGAIPRV